MAKIVANLGWLAVVTALVLPGCSIKSMANSYLLASLQGSQNSLQQSENYQLVERALPPFIVLVDSALQDDPENIPMLRKAAEFNTSYALSFIEDKDPHWASLHYQKAREYMWRVMNLKYQIQRQDIIGLQEKQVEKKLAVMGAETVPDLFWWGMSWGLLINVKRDDVATISEFPYVRIIMQRVLQLAPGYQNGLPHLFFGVYYGSSTKALGGKPEEGKKHFEQIAQITHGEFLLAKVLCAKTYARSVQKSSSI